MNVYYCGIPSLNGPRESVSWHLVVRTFYELLFKGCIIAGYSKCICMRQTFRPRGHSHD